MASRSQNLHPSGRSAVHRQPTQPSSESPHVPIAPAGATRDDTFPADELWQQDQQRKRKQKQKRLACKQCRQSKARCENPRQDGYCIRCRRLNLECVYDNEYHRVNKRLKIQELVDEVSQLRNLVQSQGARSPASKQPTIEANHQSHSQPSVPLGSVESPIVGAALDSSASPPVRGSRNDQRMASAQCSRQLDGVSLDPVQIDRLFETFFDLYHPHFPILNPSLAPDECYSLSTILFWVIIGIAARRAEASSTLLGVLAPKIRSLLWMGVASPPHNRHTVKAWTLLCLWPFPTSSMTTDPSYLLASVARSSAMHVGLHRPEIVQDFSRARIRLNAEELHCAIRTWVGCFVAAETITCIVGQPPLFESDATLDLLAASPRHEALPDQLMSLMQVYRFINRTNRMMGSRDMSTAKLMWNETSLLLTMLDREFRDLCGRVQPRTVGTEIALLYACVQFRCYHFFEEPGSSSRKEGLLKGLAAAFTVAEKTHAAQSDTSFLNHAPEIFRHAVLLSAMFIMKIARSCYAQDIDTTKAGECFNLCHGLLRQMSLEDNDLQGRGAKILEQLWNSDSSNGVNSVPSLKIKTRLSACLLHDTLWWWREKFGGQQSRQPSPPPAIASSHQIFYGNDVNGDQSSSIREEAGTQQHSRSATSTLPTGDDPRSIPAAYPSQFMPSGHGNLNYDLALMPDDFGDSYWEIMLDGSPTLDL